jgi:hypothetical protein
MRGLAEHRIDPSLYATQLVAAALCFSAMTRRIAAARLLLACALMAILAVVAQGAPAGLDGSLPYVLPPLLLLLTLARRRYPGEQALLALMGKRRGRPRCSTSTSATPGPGLRALVPRGGRLIATSLAVRPPPAHVAVSRTY